MLTIPSDYESDALVVCMKRESSRLVNIYISFDGLSTFFFFFFSVYIST